jgi:hypothetical protein
LTLSQDPNTVQSLEILFSVNGNGVNLRKYIAQLRSGVHPNDDLFEIQGQYQNRSLSKLGQSYLDLLQALPVVVEG